MINKKCDYCGKEFCREAKFLRYKHSFCSHECFCLFSIKKQKLNCPVCGREFERIPKEIKKSKSGNCFCSRSCAATWNNQHKTKGTRISKLELWLQQKLSELYPNLKFEFNQKDAINSELDIYIPELKLAFELNGIYHYEPIHGDKKFEQIQNNDNRKFAACLEKEISLCIIDTSKQVHFREKASIPYLNIIKEIIDKELV